MQHNNLRGEGGVDNNPGSTNKYTKYSQLIIRKIIEIIATRCHILRIKCTKFYSRRMSVRSPLRWSLTLRVDYTVDASAVDMFHQVHGGGVHNG